MYCRGRPPVAEWSSAPISSSSTSCRVALLLYYAVPRRAQHLVLTIAELSSSTAGRTRCSRCCSCSRRSSTTSRARDRAGRARRWSRRFRARPGGPDATAARRARRLDRAATSRCSASSSTSTSGCDSYDALVELARPAGARPRRGAARDAAARHQLLHVPVDELRHRRYRGDAARDPELHRLRVLRLDVPAARRGSDHPLLGGRGPAPDADAHDDEVRAGRRVLLPRPGEEGAAGQSVRQDRGPRVRRRLARPARRVVRRHGLRVPDLLRLQRLLGHGHRPRADARLRVPEELRLALPRRSRSPSSGGAGTSRCRPGCATTSTCRSAATARAASAPTSTCSS